jgi:chorismate-pyruvate lyase
VGINRGMIYPEKSGEHLHDAIGLAQAFFEPLTDLGSITPVGEADLPPDYLTLLAHSGHMTITLEAWHESLVNVHVEGECREPDRYARHSLLSRQSDGRVVQSGIMRIDLTGLPIAVRREIEVGETPLGRILIRADLLREVELLALWRIAAGPRLARELDLPPGTPVHGRSARILVEGRPAVELLEIVHP